MYIYWCILVKNVNVQQMYDHLNTYSTKVFYFLTKVVYFQIPYTLFLDDSYSMVIFILLGIVIVYLKSFLSYNTFNYVQKHLRNNT